MARRKTQYRRKPPLRRDFEKARRDIAAHEERYLAWKNALSRGLSELAINKIADLLARLGFEPNEHGVPCGDWPLITETNPLVILDGFRESIGARPEGVSSEQNTLEWKADVLQAATLIWAGAITPDEIAEFCPRATMGDVFILLQYSDLKAFWGRPGVGKTAQGIRAEWERGEFYIDKTALADMLRRAKGGIFA